MTENKSIAERTIVVILAAGKGTRMGRSDLSKVCFEIDSVPAISRVITAFKRQRFNKFLLGTLFRCDFLIPKRPIKRDGKVYWIRGAKVWMGGERKSS